MSSTSKLDNAIQIEDRDPPLLDLLNGFILELRQAGLPVSLTESLDAMEAVSHIPIEDREAFKYALGATLVKNNSHWKSFELVFEVYFSIRGSEYVIHEDSSEVLQDQQLSESNSQENQSPAGGGAMSGLSPEELQEMLFRALLNGDQEMMRLLARQSVIRYAGMEPGRPVGGTYYLYRTLRNLDLDSMLDRLMSESREQALNELTQLEERLEMDEYKSRIEELKKQIESEIRRSLVADRGVEALSLIHI